MKRIKEHKKPIIAVAAVIALAGGTYMLFGPRERSTENAYLNADVVRIASLVGGRIVAVHVADNQHVRKGDSLFDVDPAPFQIALARAEADLAGAMQAARQDSAEVAAMRAQVEQTSIDLNNARASYGRSKELVAKNFLTQQGADDALAHVKALEAVLEQSEARLKKALSAPARTEERADVLRARAEIAQAKLDLEHAHVTAVVDGQISSLSLTPGTLVSVGTPLFALIADNSYHVDANFKETELPGIHPGEDVDIKIDMYPGQRFKGTVESLSGGTGTAFSLLPAQNATGNWVKIAQRVPVRIKLAPPDADHPLRIGATATVSVKLQ